MHDAGHPIGRRRLEALAALPTKPQGTEARHVRHAEEEVELLQGADGAPLSEGSAPLGPPQQRATPGVRR